jgi:hypothetical protein
VWSLVVVVVLEMMKAYCLCSVRGVTVLLGDGCCSHQGDVMKSAADDPVGVEEDDAAGVDYTDDVVDVDDVDYIVGAVDDGKFVLAYIPLLLNCVKVHELDGNIW